MLLECSSCSHVEQMGFHVLLEDGSLCSLNVAVPCALTEDYRKAVQTFFFLSDACGYEGSCVIM